MSELADPRELRRPGQQVARPGLSSAPRYRRRPGLRLGAAILAAAIALAGCSALGLDTAAPSETIASTSAAPVASQPSTAAAVVVPTAPTSAGPAPTPWQSLTTTASSTTTSQPPQTAPTTTHTLTFTTVASATAPTIAAPTEIASPPPGCYGTGGCPALDRATASAGKVEVVNPPDGATTVAVLTVGSKTSAATMSRFAKPAVSCAGSYCLVQGSKSGLHFATLLRIKDGALRTVPGTPSSTRAFTLIGGGAPVVAGTYQFDGYGLWPQDAPQAARTWALSGGELRSTGCGQPYLYRTPPAAGGALSGPCTGTPKVAGLGSASAHKMVQLGGFVTPSGNIACALTLEGTLACTAKKHSIPVKQCTVSTRKIPKALRGLRVMLGSGGASYDNCLGYTLMGAPTTKISYNRVAAGGGFVCEVQEAGVTCRNKSGSGFTLSSSALSRF